MRGPFIAFAILLLVLAGCSDPREDIVGNWKKIKGYGSGVVVRFMENGKGVYGRNNFSYAFTSEKNLNVSLFFYNGKGNFEVSGDTLTLSYFLGTLRDEFNGTYKRID